MCSKYCNCEFCGYYHQCADNEFVCLADYHCDDVFQCIETDCSLDCLAD